MTFRLRSYQADACKAVIDTFAQSDPRIQRTLMVMPTGAGKSSVAAELIKRWQPKRCLYIADRDELCSQPLKTIAHVASINPGLEKARSFCSDTDRVVIASIQSLNNKVCKGSESRRFERFPPDHWDRIICDEAHLALSPSHKRVLTYFSESRVLGMTATPYRGDARPLGEVFETIAYETSYPKLVEQGYLVPPLHIGLDTEIDLEAVTDFSDGENEELGHALDPYLEKIALELTHKAKGRKILAFLPLIATAQKFNNHCREAGLISTATHGNDPDRSAKLQAFSAGKIDVLCNSALFTTGVDIPICDAILCLRPLFSATLYHQICGRSYRTLPGVLDGLESPAQRRAAIAGSAKPNALLIDPLWLLGRHGLVGPGSIMATNALDAEAITKKIRQQSGQIDLELIANDYQAEKELALLEAIRNAPKRPEGLIDVLQYAAQTHNRNLIDFIPISRIEAQPLTQFDRLILKKHGIDPDTVTNRGQFRELTKAIYQDLYLEEQLRRVRV